MPIIETLVRAVELTDLPAIAAILNEEIAYGFAHFGTEPVSVAELESELAQANRYAWLAAIEADTVVGFARANPWKSRGGYRFTCEIGVYIRRDRQGKGIGKALYSALLPTLRERGFLTILAGIALPNEPSVRLHERFGFRPVGAFPKVGWKGGEWRDVGYWALNYQEE